MVLEILVSLFVFLVIDQNRYFLLFFFYIWAQQKNLI